MSDKTKLALAICFALGFLVLTVLALDVVPKLIEDKFYVFGMASCWSTVVSLLFYGIAAMSGFYAWLMYRHIKMKKHLE